MKRYVLAAVLLLSGGWQAMTPLSSPPLLPSTPDQKSTLYLPMLHKAPGLEVVETARGEVEGYPTLYYAHGYVRNPIGTAFYYSVSVSVQITIYPYSEPPAPPPEPYDIEVGVAPALTATLPGQPNPYAYELLLGKASAYIHPVRNASGSPWTGGEVYYPLTIVSSMTSTITSTLPATAVLSGTVRNDSGLPLHLARVVTIPGKCHWRETRLDTRTLLAGQGTGFYLRDVSACLDDKMMIVGQAAAGP